MKALLYEDWDKITLADKEKPEPVRGEILVRVEACGLCGSELETFKTHSPRRTPPLVLGHEFAGRVEATGPDVSGFSIGQKVMVNSVISCGKCAPCRRGQTHLCRNRQVFGMNRPGAMAEFVIAPAEFVYPLPEDFSPVSGALVEPLANAVHVIDLLPQERDPVLVLFGAGPIGLMILQAARVLLGARVIAVDKKPKRLQYAKDAGAVRTVNPDEEDIAHIVESLTASEGADISVDAVGTSGTKETSVDILRPGGTALWIGLYNNEMKLESYKVVLKEKKIIGSYSASRDDFLRAADLMYTGQVSGENWVTTFAMNEAVDAFYRMLDGSEDDCKAVVLPQERKEQKA